MKVRCVEHSMGRRNSEGEVRECETYMTGHVRQTDRHIQACYRGDREEIDRVPPSPDDVGSHGRRLVGAWPCYEVGR